MKKMFNSLIRPYLDYCAQLWAPMEGPSLDKLENVLKKYTKLIPELKHLKYSDGLKFGCVWDSNDLVKRIQYWNWNLSL